MLYIVSYLFSQLLDARLVLSKKRVLPELGFDFLVLLTVLELLELSLVDEFLLDLLCVYYDFVCGFPP